MLQIIKKLFGITPDTPQFVRRMAQFFAVIIFIVVAGGGIVMTLEYLTTR